MVLQPYLRSLRGIVHALKNESKGFCKAASPRRPADEVLISEIIYITDITGFHAAPVVPGAPSRATLSPFRQAGMSKGTMQMNILIIANSPLQSFGLTKFIGERIENAVIESLTELPAPAGEKSRYSHDIVILCLSQADDLQENLGKLKAVSYRCSKSRILVLENAAEKKSFESLKAYLNTGISGFLTSTNPLDMLDECLRKLRAGQKYLSPSALEWLLDNAFPPKQENNRALTSRESYIAKQLAEGRTVSQIAKETNRKVSTISTIKKNIFRKTNTDNIIKLRELVLNSGMRNSLQMRM